MRRKPPAKFRDCVVAFLKQAAGGYKTISCDLHPPSLMGFDDDARAFIDAYNAEVGVFPDPYLPTITEADFEGCLDWFVSYPGKIPFQSVNFSLSRYYEISSWTLEKGNKAVLHSELVENFGTMQMLGTRLEFETVDEYYWVKAAVKRIFGLELNDKHVRPKCAVS